MKSFWFYELKLPEDKFEHLRSQQILKLRNKNITVTEQPVLLENVLLVAVWLD